MLDKRSECLWPDTTTIEVVTVQSWEGRVFVDVTIFIDYSKLLHIYTEGGKKQSAI